MDSQAGRGGKAGSYIQNEILQRDSESSDRWTDLPHKTRGAFGFNRKKLLKVARKSEL